MTGKKSSFDVLHCFNVSASNRMSCHDFLSANLLAWDWNFFNQYWHLLSSDTSIVKSSCEKCCKIVRNENGDQQRHVDVDLLRSLHQNDT